MTLPNDIVITPQLVADHGLKPDEYQKILDLLGRTQQQRKRCRGQNRFESVLHCCGLLL